MTRARGSILITALWTLGLLTVIAVSLGYAVRQKITLLSRLEQMDLLSSAALSGVDKARALVRDDLDKDYDSLLDAWATSTAHFKGISLGKATVTVGYETSWEKEKFHYGVMDEESKINLNKADAAVLQRLLETAGGLNRDEAEPIAHSIVDWRDGDSNYQHPNYGAEDRDYEDLQIPYDCKDAPFESVNELLLIRGIKRPLFDKIRNLITAHGNGQINVNTASPEVLIALGMQENLVGKMSKYRAGTDGEIGTEDDRFFIRTSVIASELERAGFTPDGAEQGVLSNLVQNEKINVASSAFMAQSKSWFGNGFYLEMEAVFDRKGKIYYVRSSGAQWPSRR